MINVVFRKRGPGRRHVRAGVATALTAAATLVFATPAAFASGSDVAPTGKAGSLRMFMASPAGRQVNVGWNSQYVNWGTGLVKRWVVEITPPTGGRIVNNGCAGVIESSYAIDACVFTGSVDGTYAVKVTAQTPVGTSPESATATLAVKQTVFVPGAPQSLKVVPGSAKLVVSWQPPADPGDGVTGYHAEAVPSVNPQGDAGHCDTTQLTCTITGLDPNTSYDVWVFSNGKTDHSPEPAKVQNVKPLGPVSGTPTPPASVPSSAGKLTAPSTSLTTDKSVTLSGAGYAAGVPVQVVLYSSPKVLKTVTSDSTGSFSTSVTLPAGLSGSHTLVAGGVGTDGKYRYLTLSVAVSSTGGGLPVTGASVPKLVGAALLVLAFGVMLVRVGRRRRA